MILQSQASYQNNKRLVIRCAVYLYSAGVGALVEAWAVFSADWWTVGWAVLGFAVVLCITVWLAAVLTVWAKLGFANNKLLAIAMSGDKTSVLC